LEEIMDAPNGRRASRTRVSPWPASAELGRDGLRVGGLFAEELAAEHGTPLLVYDEGEVRARCSALARRFPGALYAVKAFTARAAIVVALEEGLGVLAASGGELAASLRAGADPSRMVLHGNNKSDAELELAVSAGLGLVVVDNRDELVRLDEIATSRSTVASVLLRVTPGITGGTHRYIETGGSGSKFGMPVDEAVEAARLTSRLRGLRLRGLHSHVGSQLLRVEPVLASLNVLLDLAGPVWRASGHDVEVLDLGGGFGVTYTDEPPVDLDELATALDRHLRSGCERRGLPRPSLIVEPGRWVMANAGITLYRVGTVKRANGRTIVAVDGGMSDNVRPALYGARHALALAGAPRPDSPVRASVVGKHCESGDVLACDVELPWQPQRGDLLAVAATGAYCYSMASTYNRVPRPAVVAVQDGAAQTWLRRETEDDLNALEPELTRSAAP